MCEVMHLNRGRDQQTMGADRLNGSGTVAGYRRLEERECAMFESRKKEELVRREAHLLWLAEGKPDGRDKARWEEAERLVDRIEEARNADESIDRNAG